MDFDSQNESEIEFWDDFLCVFFLTRFGDNFGRPQTSNIKLSLEREHDFHKIERSKNGSILDDFWR